MISGAGGVVAATSWAEALALPLVAVAVLSSVVAAEIYSYGTKTAVWLVRAAVALLPAEKQDRYREEWMDHVLTKSGDGEHHLTALVWACGIVVSAVRLARPTEALVQWARVEVRSTGSGPVMPFGFGLMMANTSSSTAIGLGVATVAAAGFTVVVCSGTWVGRRLSPSGYVANKGYKPGCTVRIGVGWVAYPRERSPGLGRCWF